MPQVVQGFLTGLLMLLASTTYWSLHCPLRPLLPQKKKKKKKKVKFSHCREIHSAVCIPPVRLLYLPGCFCLQQVKGGALPSVPTLSFSSSPFPCTPHQLHFDHLFLEHSQFFPASSLLPWPLYCHGNLTSRAASQPHCPVSWSSCTFTL